MKKINILGTEYTIEERTVQEDASLKDADAYCDRTTREIVVLKFTEDECTIHNPEWYRKKLLRHEIIHAFLFESGLGECSEWSNNNTQHSEQFVDWIAIQAPKLFKAFMEADCLDVIPREAIIPLTLDIDEKDIQAFKGFARGGVLPISKAEI